MATTIEVRPLTEDDRFVGMPSGDPTADRFFRYHAATLQFGHQLALTFVAVEDYAFAGFATVSRCTLEKKDPKPGTLPVIRLAHLAVTPDHTRARRALLRHVLGVALKERDNGCGGVVVDATPALKDHYAAMGFLEIDDVREGRLHGHATPMFLDIDTISAAFAG